MKPMMASTAHPLPDAWLGTRLQLAIRDIAVINGYADSLSARLAGRHARLAGGTDHPSYYEAYDLVRRAFATRSPRSAAANASRWRAPSPPMIPLRMPEPTGMDKDRRA